MSTCIIRSFVTRKFSQRGFLSNYSYHYSGASSSSAAFLCNNYNIRRDYSKSLCRSEQCRHQQELAGNLSNGRKMPVIGGQYRYYSCLSRASRESTGYHLSHYYHLKSCEIHTSPLMCHGDYEYQDPKSEAEVVNVTYVLRDGSKRQIRGKIGDNVMYLAHRHDIPIEGACEASLACSTCHVYVNDDYFDRLPEAVDEEEDMLDLAVFLKPNSRLGCQIILTKELDGIEVSLPSATRNFYVDGHVPEPH